MSHYIPERLESWRLWGILILCTRLGRCKRQGKSKVMNSGKVERDVGYMYRTRGVLETREKVE